MKKIVSALFCLFCFLNSNAQVGIGTSTPSASAKLEIASTTQGFLPPRMTSAERGNISNPANGLIVYQTDATAGLYYFNGSSWIYIINSTTAVLPVSNGGTGTSNGSITGSSALTFAAGGSNQDITLSPSGTGNSILNGSVGVGTSSPDGSAIVELNSTTKGFLPPRMTYSQRNSINSPAQGLIIYCTTCGVSGELEVFNGSVWTNLVGGAASSVTVGQSDFGGKIAYIFQNGDPGYVAGEVQGLVASSSDLSAYARWGCNGATLSGAWGTALLTGNQNTLDILAECAEGGIAASICADYSLTVNGTTYSDWWLPSIDELGKLYASRGSIGGFSTPTTLYWSSSQAGSIYAYVIKTTDGGVYVTNKSGGDYGIAVRAVRRF
jgi:hypothetical protein